MNRIWMIAIFIAIATFSGPAFPGEEVVSLPEVEVEGTFQEDDFVGPIFTETNTKTKITQNMINVLGPSSRMSITRAINLIPSVSQQSVDPCGLTDISNYHESFRFRGIEPTGGGNPSTPVNMENIPVTVRPGGGAFIYDLENFSGVAIYKGGVPADKAFGLTNIGGKIDMEIKRPQEGFDFYLKQALGSDDFRRTFLRLDTGLFPTGTAGFISYSNTNADKWKGKGDSDRNNAMLGLTQQFGGLKIEAFSIINESKTNTYRPFSYEQASRLAKNYSFDFSDDATNYFYYGYNKCDFEDFNIFANIEYHFTKSSSLAVKPFYGKDDGYYLETITMQNGNNRIRRWGIDHELRGVLIQYSLKTQSINFNLGYFYLEQERPGPPTSWKLYKLSSDDLFFDKWQILSNNSKHRQHTPFVSGKYSIGPFAMEGGVKYLRYSMPEIKTYDTTGLPDVSYEEALDMASSVDADASTRSKDFNKLLPHFGLSYVLNDYLSCYFSYGRNYGMSVKLYPYFISQKNALYAKGITLQDLWDDQELEIADNFDFGLRFITDKLYVVPTVYYAKHRNKAATYYDTSLVVSFPASVFDAVAYGFELETGIMPIENLSLYSSFSYNRFCFSQDIYDGAGTVIPVDGNQVPDAPEFLVKGIASYRIGDFTFSPIVRYTSCRYGDILHEEKIGGATIFDFVITYTTAFPRIWIKKLDCSLALNNIFDKEYVSIINTDDYRILGPSYQAGAPFTVYAYASVNF